MACEGSWPCCHCHCGDCLCCDPYTTKTDCGLCDGCIHTVRIARPKPAWKRWRNCRGHQFITYSYMGEPARRICDKCGYPEPAPLDVAALQG